MLLLATQAEPQMRQFAHPNLGRLVQPRHYPRLADTASRGVPWAADNDGFNGFDDAAAARFERMLAAIEGTPGCRFIACPDVLGEAGLTDLLFEEWAPLIARRGFPIAYVVQEAGCEYEAGEIPWSRIAAVFIGGADDRERLGPRIRRIAREAKQRGKWLHMGRVNSRRRIAYAREIGCDSFDGTAWVRWRNRYLAEGVECASAPPQISLLS